MAKEDEEFYRDRIELLETEGWADLIEELKVMSESVKRLESIDNRTRQLASSFYNFITLTGGEQ